eukprot:6207500-Pleurochrysis_carterae.AAC.2
MAKKHGYYRLGSRRPEKGGKRSSGARRASGGRLARNVACASTRPNETSVTCSITTEKPALCSSHAAAHKLSPAHRTRSARTSANEHPWAEFARTKRARCRKHG